MAKSRREKMADPARLMEAHREAAGLMGAVMRGRVRDANGERKDSTLLVSCTCAAGRVTGSSGLAKRAAEVFVVFILVSSVNLNDNNSHGVALHKLTLDEKDSARSIVSFES